MSEGESTSLVPTATTEALDRVAATTLLAQVRPEWQARNLIARVKRLLPIDASSACQRILNAAFRDLREKIVHAGIDIAKEAAVRFKLPAVTQPEDVLENYSNAKVLDLAYRLGLVSRAEWRRLNRSYEIRRDLEHEDDQYEAEPEDVLYVFRTAINVVLSRDPVTLLRRDDVEELVNSPGRAAPTTDFLTDYKIAPEVRQQEIMEYLINVALDSKQADVIRQNAVEFLRSFEGDTKQPVKVVLGKHLQSRCRRGRLELVVAKVAKAAGVLVYLKQRQLRQLFEFLQGRLDKVGYTWQQHGKHGEVLDEFHDVGGLRQCPSPIREQIVKWMALCYLGEPGERGYYGRHRKVFYSNSASFRIEQMFKEAGNLILDELEAALSTKVAKKAVQNIHIARRAERLRDLVAEE